MFFKMKSTNFGVDVSRVGGGYSLLFVVFAEELRCIRRIEPLT